MRITNPLLTKALGLFGAALIRGWTSTLDYRIVYHDPTVDPTHPFCRPRALYVLWHEYLICPLGVRGRHMTVLISQHRDGELITRVLRHLGFNVVRGSSTRGGIAAVKQLLKKSGEWRVASGENQPTFLARHSPLATRHLIVTPDGPRGPRRQLEKGAVFLASRLGIPIVCMGFAFDRPWRLSSWDQFAIPRPYSRARAVISPYLEVPQNLSPSGEVVGHDSNRVAGFNSIGMLSHDALEPYRVQVEQCLNQVTLEAEQWAKAGGRYMGRIGNPIYEMPFLRNQPPPLDRSTNLERHHGVSVRMALEEK